MRRDRRLWIRPSRLEFADGFIIGVLLGGATVAMILKALERM